eukprot:12688622-Alexandrium_andersonii.AAC.1
MSWACTCDKEGLSSVATTMKTWRGLDSESIGTQCWSARDSIGQGLFKNPIRIDDPINAQ